MRSKLTTIILTRDPLQASMTLSSVRSCSNEIIFLIDGTSKDRVVDGIRYVYHPLAGDFARHRQYGQSQASHNMVLFLDDDEYLSKALEREIAEMLSSRPTHQYYQLNRIDIVWTRQMIHGEQGRLYFTRLVDKRQARWSRAVHETIETRDRHVHTLSHPLYHLKDRFVSGFISSMSLYSQIDATCLLSEHKPFSYHRLLLLPPAKFLYNYIFRRGFMDGYPGLFHAYLMSVQSFTVRVVQWSHKI
jgi:hypothetical protein